MAFLTISDQYETFFAFFFTKWPSAPISDVRNSLLNAFLAISDRYATFFFSIFDKMTAVDYISGHFRSKRNFIYIFFDFRSIRDFHFLEIWTKWLPSAILDVRNSLPIVFLAILDQYGILFVLEILTKWLPSAILDVRPKFTSDRISDHFRSIRNFYFFWKFFTKWLPSAILVVRNSLSIAFLAILDQYATYLFWKF